MSPEELDLEVVATSIKISKQLAFADEQVLDRLFEGDLPDRSEDRTAMSCVIANLYDGALRGMPVSVPLRKSAFTLPKRYGFEHFRWARIRDVVNALAENELITVRPGHPGLVTRISAAPALVDALTQLGDTLHLRQIPWADPIIMKSRDKTLVDYKDTGERNRLRNGVVRLNALLARTDISLPANAPADDGARKRLKAQRSMYRVFNNGKFTLGGRYYGGGWQSLPASVRARLRLDGEPVVELDYTGLHPSMLYAREGLDPEGDVYSLDNDRRLRPLGKLIVNIAFNATSDLTALRALRWRLKDKPKATALLAATGLTLGELFARYKERHSPIRKYFGSGVGRKLQRWDSDIMTRVINAFVQAGVPILPVHDSALVPAQYEEELRAAMIESYRRQFGREIEVKRK